MNEDARTEQTKGPAASANAPRGIGTREWGVYAVCLALLVALYWRAARELYTNWTIADSYYSHGFLVPPISAFLIWRERGRLVALPRSSSTFGYAWIAGATFLVLGGDFLGFRVFGHLSIIPMLVGLSLLFQGAPRTRHIWFSLAFLLFMVPIPPSLTQSFALRLKLLAAECSVRLAKLVTLPMIREGSTIYFKDDQLLIGDVCGGLRSLIALLALGAVMAYLSRTKVWARVLVLVMAGPIAVLSNVIRIFLLCVVGYFYGSEVAGGTVHDVSGYMIFVVAFALFLGLESLLRRLSGTAPSGDEGAPPAEPGGRAPGNRVFAAALVIVAGVTACHVGLIRAQAAQERSAAGTVTFDIPERIADYTQVGRNKDVDDRTKELLETSSILIRAYEAPSGRPVVLTIVHAGTTRRSLHFPEVCLVGAGWEVQRQESVRVGILFSARRLLLRHNEQQEAVLYWFKTGDELTGNYFLNAYHWAKNQLTFSTSTSSMIRLSTPVSGGGLDDAFMTLEDFAGKFMPILLERVD